MIAVLVILWMTEALHGYDIAFITMVGSMLFIASIGIMGWKQGIQSVSGI